MFATILTLLVVAAIVYLLKRKSDKEIAKAQASAGLERPTGPGNSGGGGADTTIKPGDPGYDSIVDTARGAQGPGPNN